LNYDLVDIDYEIEASQGISISELVANQGWKKFREIES
jgi:shikimate kinase